MILMVDNKSAINLAKDTIAHRKSKHNGTRFHFLSFEALQDKSSSCRYTMTKSWKIET